MDGIPPVGVMSDKKAAGLDPALQLGRNAPSGRSHASAKIPGRRRRLSEMASDDDAAMEMELEAPALFIQKAQEREMQAANDLSPAEAR